MTRAAEPSGGRGPSPEGNPGSRLYANAAYLWGNTALTALAGLGLWVIVASLRDTDQVGAGAAAASAMMLLVMLSHLGLGSGLIRFLPEAGGEAACLMNAAFSLGALVAGAASALFLLGLPLWAPRLGFLRDNPLLALSFVLFTMAATVFWIQDQALLARRRGEHLFLRSLLHNLMRLLLPLGVLAGLAGATGVVVSVGLPVLISVVLGAAIFLPAALPGYRPVLTLAREPIARLLPFSSGAYASELLMIAPGLTLPLMALALRSSEETGYFYVAWFLGYLLSTVSFSLGLSLFAEGSHSEAELPRLIRASLRRGLALAAAGAAVVLVFADEALLLFGREYSDNAATLLRIVAVAAVPAVITNLYLAAERVRKQIGSLVSLGGVVAGSTLGISYVLLPVMGLTGAGIGILAGQGLGAALALARGFPRSAAAPEAAPPGPQEREPSRAAAARRTRTTFGRPTVSAVVCAINEASNLKHVLPAIPSWVNEVILVDGRSTDDTVAVARSLRPDIRILYQKGYGKGDALRHGVQNAHGQIIVTLDADGETDPRDLPAFVDRLTMGHDFVKGSRFAGGWRHKPLHRLLGNFLIVATCNLLYRTRFTDLCSGYNAFWRDLPERVNLWAADDWNYEPLILARVLRAGLGVVEQPQSYRGRVDSDSKLSSWTQGLTSIKVLIRERLRSQEKPAWAARRTQAR